MNYIKPTPSMNKKTIYIMNLILEERSKGKSREECAAIANIKNQRIQNWYTEGKHGIGKEKTLFYEHLKKIEDKLYAKDIRKYNNSTNTIKRKEYINNIRQGQTIKEASKNASIDLKLLTKWEDLGKIGIEPFKNFLSQYNKAKIESKSIKTLKEDILNPLPKKWQKYFENKPMNKTGIAWVTKIRNNYIYQRQNSNKHIKIADQDIYELYTKVIKKNYTWGIRDINKAQKIIKKTTPHKNEKITVEYNRLKKNNIKIKINGLLKNNEVKTAFDKLKFFDIDMTKRYEKKINNKTEIHIEYKIDIALLNTFEKIINGLGWKIIKTFN